MGPLAGIRIIDMTTVLMGPSATQLLGDMGADVVKVEAPGGDIVRQIGPGRNPGMGGMFLNLNRNKRSVVIDVKIPEGFGVLRRLLETADLLVYNVRPQAMERLGLTYEAVAAINSRIIYVGIYGFGSAGPYGGRPAYDDLIQGATGIAALTGAGGDGTPRYSPIPMADRMVGLFAVGAINAALFARERSGVGQRIDVPMFEVMSAQVMGDHMSGLVFDPPLDHGGYQRLLSRDRKPFRTSDGFVCAVIYNDKHWRSFLTLSGHAALLEDERFRDHANRTRSIDAIYGILSSIFLERTTAEWSLILEQGDIPCMPMHTLESLLDDPHLSETNFFSFADHPSEGRIRCMSDPTQWSGTKPGKARLAPRLGEHTAEVLAEIGYARQEIDGLLRAQAIRDADRALA